MRRQAAICCFQWPIFLKSPINSHPLWKIVDGILYAEAGDVSDNALDNMRSVTGIGVRIGLPPDFRVKLRFDLGMSDEGEHALFVNLGQFY